METDRTSVRWADEGVPPAGVDSDGEAKQSSSLLVEEQLIAAVGKSRPTPPTHRNENGNGLHSTMSDAEKKKQLKKQAAAAAEVTGVRGEAAKKLAKSLGQCAGVAKVRELPKAERRAFEKAGLRTELAIFTLHDMPVLDGAMDKAYRRTVKRLASRLVSTIAVEDEELAQTRANFLEAAMDKRCSSAALGEMLSALLAAVTPRASSD